MSYLFALDPSLTCSGWALFSLKTLEPIKSGMIKSLSTQFSIEQRLADLQRQVVSLFNELSLTNKDYFICEGPAPLVLNPNSAMKVERVRGIFESIARSQSLNILDRINPRTVQSELMGLKGKQIERKQVKQIAKDLAHKMFPAYLEQNKANQDILDAMLIGALVSSRLKIAIDTKQDYQQLYAKKQRRSKRWKESDLLRLRS